MLNLTPSTKIFLCSMPIDMRWSFDALSGMVQTHFGQNPLNGRLFVFFSKGRDRMKILFWNIDGFVLYYKRLERGTFSWVYNLIDENNSEILASDFEMVLAGINPVEAKRTKRLPRIPTLSSK